MNWIVGEIGVALPGRTEPVAGWVWKSFGIDFRPIWYEGASRPAGAGWVITHLPTGRAVLGLAVEFREAMAIAEEIDEWTDWSRVDPSSARFLRSRWKDLTARLGIRWLRAADLSPPWLGYSIESAPETVP